MKHLWIRGSSGPCLFVIFINDLPEHVMNTVQMFADDTKFFTQINTQLDADRLQKDINTLSKWSEDWQIKFNASKCKVLHLGKRNPEYTYKWENTCPVIM